VYAARPSASAPTPQSSRAESKTNWRRASDWVLVVAVVARAGTRLLFLFAVGIIAYPETGQVLSGHEAGDVLPALALPDCPAFACRSGLDHLARAFLEVGFLRDGTSGVERQLVDQAMLVEERDEHQAGRKSRASCRTWSVYSATKTLNSSKVIGLAPPGSPMGSSMLTQSCTRQIL